MKLSASLLKEFLTQIKHKKSAINEVVLEFRKDSLYASTMDQSQVRLVTAEMPLILEGEPFELNIGNIETLEKGLGKFKDSEVEISLDPKTCRLLISNGKKTIDLPQVASGVILRGREPKSVPKTIIRVSEEDFKSIRDDADMLEKPLMTFSNKITKPEELHITLETERTKPTITTILPIQAMEPFQVSYYQIPDIMAESEGDVEIKFNPKEPVFLFFTTKSGIKVRHIMAPIIDDLVI